MKDKDKIIKYSIWGVISFQTVLTGIFFIVQILRLYSVNHGFTRELTISYLLEMIVVIILWVVFVIGGMVLSFIFKLEDKRLSKNGYVTKLNTILYNIPEETKNSDEFKVVTKNRNKRYIAYLIATIISLICAFFIFSYMFNPDHFITSDNPTKQCVELFKHITPFVAICFICFILAKVYEEINAKATIEICKKMMDPKACVHEYKNNKKTILILQISILSIALIMVIVGASIGGAEDVWLKASKICTECIGLG